MKKKLLMVLLTAALCASMCPTVGLAAETGDTTPETITQENPDESKGESPDVEDPGTENTDVESTEGETLDPASTTVIDTDITDPADNTTGSESDTGDDSFQISIEDATIEMIDSAEYTGEEITPALVVKFGDQELTVDKDYSVSYDNNINVGTATVEITGAGDYTGTLTQEFAITPKKVTPEITLSKASFVYNGKEQKPTVDVKVDGNPTSDYDVAYTDGRKDVGTYTVTVNLNGNYEGTASKEYKITQANQPMTATAVAKSIGNAKLASAKQVVSGAISVKKAQGAVTYKKIGGSNALTINATTGKITVKKGTKAGKYPIKVRVTAKGNKNYKSGSKDVNVNITVSNINKGATLTPETLWSNCEYCYSVMFNKFPAKGKITSIKSSNRSVIKPVKEGSGQYDNYLIPLKTGTSKITVTYKVGAYTYRSTATYTVKKYPNPYKSITLNGKKLNISKNKYYYDVNNYTKTNAKIKFTLKTGWKIADAYMFLEDSSGNASYKDLKAKTLTSGQSISIPKGKTAHIFADISNSAGEIIQYGIALYR